MIEKIKNLFYRALVSKGIIYYYGISAGIILGALIFLLSFTVPHKQIITVLLLTIQFSNWSLFIVGEKVKIDIEIFNLQILRAAENMSPKEDPPASSKRYRRTITSGNTSKILSNPKTLMGIGVGLVALGAVASLIGKRKK